MPRRLFTVLGLAALLSTVHAEPPAGLRLATAGHSFHYWMPSLLMGLVKDAGISGHQQVALSAIGGSRTIQHWDAQGDKQKIKPVLMEAKVDVLTLSPIFLPDAGIENFVKLGLEHHPKLRITIQESWMPFDDGSLWGKPSKGRVIERDTKTMADLHAAHDDYFKSFDDLTRELNAKYAKDRPAVFIVPVGQAVMELRHLIMEGQAPGIAKQSDLFTDPIGHPREHVKALSAYCYYAVIYGRSPIGLPMPAAIAQLPEAEKFNALLQKLAWDAVTQHPLSGVK